MHCDFKTRGKWIKIKTQCNASWQDEQAWMFKNSNKQKKFEKNENV